MMDKGTIFKFYNDLDTDQIIASQYLLLPNLDEMKEWKVTADSEEQTYFDLCYEYRLYKRK